MNTKIKLIIVSIISTLIHLVAWYYGVLMNELICGAMFIFGLYIGEDVHYEWWELIYGWYNWIINIIFVIWYRLRGEW